MVFCTKCGKQFDETAGSCPACGAPVYKQAQQPQQPQYQQPQYQQPQYQQPQYQQTQYQQPQQQAQQPYSVKQLVDTAFSKGLASVIMSAFPVASIIGIFTAVAGKRASGEAEALAKSMNTTAGGKNVAAKILSIVGLIESIGMTCFWVFYFFYFVLLMSLV